MNMIFENARAYLKSYKNKKQEITLLELSIRRAEEDVRRGGYIDGLPRKSSISHPTEEAALRLAQIRDRLRKKIDALNAECQEIEDTVSMIPDPRARLILIYKYFNGLSWSEIANHMYYSEAYCKRELHVTALELLEIEMKRRSNDTNQGNETWRLQ